MFIQNVSMDAIRKGFHYDAGVNSTLIQIVDFGYYEFPKPFYDFKEIHQFEFMDVDESQQSDPEWEFRCTEEQANKIVRILQRSLELHHNVIVHCHAGLCRSGAVAEVGIMMGFQDTETVRHPNLYVKKLLIQANGWGY